MATKAIDVMEALERLGELSKQEDRLRQEARALGEERAELAQKLDKRKRTLESYVLNGLREPEEGLQREVEELEARISEIETRLAGIEEELDEIARERIKVLKESLPQAWRKVREARARAYSPELRGEALEAIRAALEPFNAAQDELTEAEEVLGKLLAHSARVDNRAPSLLRQTLTEREGELPDPPSRDRSWRTIRAIATRVEEVG